jgi:Protein of unknown function (DUF3667)
MSTASQAHCVGCGAVVTGRYCADCGEHTEPHDYSMKHFVEEVLETTAHIDGRVFASFRSLLARPGELATDFLAGRRKTQMGPVQMFVVGFIGHLATASRRGYAEGWPAAIAKAVLLIGWLTVCLTTYRFILFFTTFYAT